MRTICFTAGLIAAVNAITLNSDQGKPSFKDFDPNDIDLQDFMSYLSQYGKTYKNSAEF